MDVSSYHRQLSESGLPLMGKGGILLVSQERGYGEDESPVEGKPTEHIWKVEVVAGFVEEAEGKVS